MLRQLNLGIGVSFKGVVA